MENRTRRRQVFTALSAVAFVVIALNIERLAEATGIDGVLVFAVENGPGWLARSIQIVTSDAALWIAVVIVAFTGGLWFERAFDRLKRMFNRPLDYEQLADECADASKIVRASAELTNYNEQHTLFIRLTLANIQMTLESKLDVVVGLGINTPEQAIVTSKLLEKIAPAIRSRDIEAIRLVEDEFKDSASEDPLLAKSGEETLL